MAYCNCLVSGGSIGGWTAQGSFPGLMSDGDGNTYAWTVGSSAVAFTLSYNASTIPDNAAITSIGVSGECSNNTGGAAQTWTCYLGAASSFVTSFTTDNTSYAPGIPRPGGGTWTKAEVGTMYLVVSCDGNGNGNPMRVRSSILTVYFDYSVVLAPIAGSIFLIG